jgi:hypothetical protein
MKFFIFFTGVTFLFSSCLSKHKEDEKGQIIVIDEINEQKLELPDITSQIKILPLETKTDESIVGHIRDICCVDDMIYILDGFLFMGTSRWNRIGKVLS